jgi:predicted dehydrogenase
MVEALRTLPDAAVAAVGSRRLPRAEEFAARHGLDRVHGSYAQLFADPDVDVVYVAAPHSHHHEMTVAALDAGKHVLCEKAFAVNAAQAREMVDAAGRNDRFLMEAMWTWFIPAIVEVRRRVDAGEIGEVLVVEANFGIPMHRPDGRHRRPDLAGGALLDLGVYPLAMARFLLGEPSDVRALGRLTDDGVDALTAGVLTFPSGALALFHTTLDGLSTGDARVVGTTGTITVHPPFWHSSGFTLRRGDHERERVEIANDGLAHEAGHVMERIRGGHRQSDVVSLDHTLAGMELTDEIRRQIGVVYPVER